MRFRIEFPSFSAGEKTGIAAYLLAFFFMWIDIRLATIPLTLFVLLCAVAPFFPSLSFFLPVVSSGNSRLKSVAVTFDDGPDPLTTRPLLTLLAKHRIRAAFFVNGENVVRHPELLREIISQGHEVGNHTYSHDNLIMLKSGDQLKPEIQKAQKIFETFGIRPLVFRPPVGVTSPRLKSVMEELQMVTVNFSLRAGDAGNRRLKKLSNRVLKKVKPGDIILLHEKMPGDPERLYEWLSELDRLFRGLQNKGIRVLPLSILIGKKVMETRLQRLSGDAGLKE